MDAAGYERDMKAHVGKKAFINQKEFCEYVGCGKAAARDLLRDVPFLRTGRERRYLIKDVARTLHGKETLV